MTFLDSYNNLFKYHNEKLSRSEEYYFGEHNPYKDRLCSWISHLREMCKDYSSHHEGTTPAKLLPMVRKESESLKDIIKDEFNVEHVNIGWINTTNAACYSQLANSNVVGSSDSAKALRIRLDDIVDTNKGFKYKNSKGIIYLIVLGFPLFCQDDYTVEEAAAVLTHELGHAMQHIVNDFNQMVFTTRYKQLYSTLKEDKDSLTPEEIRYYKKLLIKFRASSFNPDSRKSIGKEIANDDDENKYTVDFSSFDDDKLFGYVRSGDYDWDINSEELDKKLYEAKKARNNKFGHKVGKFFKSLLGTLASPFMLIAINNKADEMRNDRDGHYLTVFEEFADNFCMIYGLGVGQASFQKKMSSKYAKYRDSGGVLEHIPLLDLYFSYKELKDDYYYTMSGYPTTKQRAINIYKACEFELKNNKDLTQNEREEIKKQIEEYKSFYEDFVYDESSKGIMYRIIAGLSKKGIEDEAKKDNYVTEHVLIPLNERMKKNKEFKDTL